MRIISGSRRRMLLETPAGEHTRPTNDRIKETLFNMIGHNLADCYFLDLFAGSGQMGLEALSRGASKAFFIENDKAAYTCIENNINKLKFDSTNARLLKCDVLSGISQLDSILDNQLDYIFMDPPYNKGLEKQVLSVLKDKTYIDEYTSIIIEASLETDFDYVNELGFLVEKEKLYLSNKHVFLRCK